MAPVSARRSDAIAMFAIVAAIVAVFHPLLFGGKMLFYRDVQNYTYPDYVLIRDALLHGKLPVWNPRLNEGQPLLASPISLFFYPWTLVSLLLPAGLGYSFFYFAHFVIAGLGVYFLARRWDTSSLSAALAALVFVLSGPVLSLGSLYNHVAAVAWMPWALLAVSRAGECGRPRDWLAVIAVFSMQYLAAEPITLLATFVLSAALSFRNLRRNEIRAFAPLALVPVAVAALCAAQILPARDYLSRSLRASGLPFEESAHWSLNPISLIEFIRPLPFGGPLTPSTPEMLTAGDGELPYLPSLFIGLIPLAFAAAGWVLGRGSRRHIIGVGVVVFSLLALGRHTPLFHFVWTIFPPMQMLRYPIKFILPVVFLVSLLAGSGVDVLRSRLSESRWRRIPVAVACIGLAELLMAANTVNPFIASDFYRIQPPVLARFDGPRHAFRYFSAKSDSSPSNSESNIDRYPDARGVEPMFRGALNERFLLRSGAAMLDADGGPAFDLDESFPSYVAEFSKFLSTANSEQAARLLGRANVKYVLTSARLTNPPLHLLTSDGVGLMEPSSLYEDPFFVSRAFVAASTRLSLSSNETLKLMASSELDPNQVVLVSNPSATSERHEQTAPGHVTGVDYRDDRVSIRVEMDKPGYVVLLDRFDPNWHSDVDSQAAPIVRANQMFRAVYVSQGSHAVGFEYQQAGLKGGLAISLASLVLAGGIFFRSRKGER